MLLPEPIAIETSRCSAVCNVYRVVLTHTFIISRSIFTHLCTIINDIIDCSERLALLFGECAVVWLWRWRRAIMQEIFTAEIYGISHSKYTQQNSLFSPSSSSCALLSNDASKSAMSCHFPSSCLRTTFSKMSTVFPVNLGTIFL